MSGYRRHGTWFFLLLMAAAPQDTPKLPVPTAAEQSEAEKLIKDIFKDDYAKRSPNDRRALAKKLLEQALQSQDDPKTQYVLFREVHDLAGQNGEVEVAFSAIDELSKRFAVEVLALKSAALVAAGKYAKSPDDFRALATCTIKLIDAALLADDFDAAEKFSASATQFARKAQEAPLITRAVARTKEIGERKKGYDKVRKARETVAANPNDEASNLVIGRYECYVKANWTAGLPFLARGSDSTLKGLADRELAKPEDPGELAAVGDGWWDVAEKEKEPAVRDLLREHAGQWYSRALDKLTGLHKAKIEKRLTEYMAQKLSRGSWLDVTDPKLFGMTGKSGDPIEFSAKPGYYDSRKLQFPKGDFDGFSARLTFDSTKEMRARVFFEGPRVLAVCLDPDQGLFGAVRNMTTSLRFEFNKPWVKQNESSVMVLLIGDEYVFYLNFREMGRMKTLMTRIAHLSLEADEGTVKFDRIQLRRAE